MTSTSPTNPSPWRSPKVRRRLPDNDPQPAPSRRRNGRGVQITNRDLELLAFVAAHRFVHPMQVHELVDSGRSVTYRLLGRLVDAGLLRYERVFHGQPGVLLITNGGLGVLESPMTRPQIDLRLYRHEQAVPWLWLAATQGVFGPAAALHTERELRHHIQSGDPTSEVPVPGLGGFDRAGRPRVHYPDLVVDHGDGTVTAVELELSVKGRSRLEQILLGYQLDDRFHRVVYLSDRPQVVDAVVQAAAVAPGDERSRLRVCLSGTAIGSSRAVARAINEGVMR